MTVKKFKQQISSDQEPLYFSEAKKKQGTKKVITCQKIIFSAEVAKVLGCDIGYNYDYADIPYTKKRKHWGEHQ
ncbi:Hypothetical protein SCC1_1512 [Pectobacterium versatile]|uniref:Uncharacterized protein n=1 Tax=Pectobacterium parmentieri TaxID=1905730 RepID=A0A0H3I4V8_PECPM|nr:Hypothetical protein W5S_1641 [Pectobacterium parmentieri]ASN84951.1 Hypothetical protein SCC1_1512 [Pectobacterium versatile]